MAADAAWFMGLMSGTSLDGVDAALIRTDGRRVVDFGPALTLPYPEEFRATLRALLGRVEPDAETRRAEAMLTRWHATAARRLLARAGMAPSDLAAIGFHGQTLTHAPERGFTWQLGDGPALARATGARVAHDFRRADVEAGGQGAPLVPVYHAALAAGEHGLGPLAVLNIGGVANVTWIGARASGMESTLMAPLMAFDTGPGCAPLDDFMRARLGLSHDADGAVAARGAVHAARLDRVLSDPMVAEWLDRPPPKSLDRDAFAAVAMAAVEGLDDADGAATLAALTVRMVSAAAAHLPAAPRRWVVAGGGRRNPVLMAMLAREMEVPVAAVEDVGWDGDALEAQAFAFLAARRLAGLPATWPATTGARGPVVCGAVSAPENGTNI